MVWPGLAGKHWTPRAWVVPAILVLGLHAATAGPVHVRNSPSAPAVIIQGRHIEYAIHFDGPVDHFASLMEVVQSGRVIQSLIPLKDSAPNVLFASGDTPPPGRYVLRWQVRSLEDGVISTGDIPFSVAE